MSAASYPVYIIHQPVLVADAGYVLMLSIPPAMHFALIVIFSILLTFACFDVIRRIPVIRVLFGMTGLKKKTA